MQSTANSSCVGISVADILGKYREIWLYHCLQVGCKWRASSGILDGYRYQLSLPCLHSSGQSLVRCLEDCFVHSARMCSCWRDSQLRARMLYPGIVEYLLERASDFCTFS